MNRTIQILETPEEMLEVEALQRLVWPGEETDVVPAHMLLAASHNGGLIIGAYLTSEEESPDDMGVTPSRILAGFVFGFPGFYTTPDGPRLKHHSHMLGIHPKYRNLGLGFGLKRAQWQMVRHQGIDRITWTYDPLLSTNAWLNIARLGAVSNTYLREFYGPMRDQLNVGMPSDRLQVDWWVNSQRVYRRLSKRPRPALDLAHFTSADTILLNSSLSHPSGTASRSETHSEAGDRPMEAQPPPRLPLDIETIMANLRGNMRHTPVLLLEIPADYQALKASDPSLALQWRMATRDLFEALFFTGYIATDFIHQPQPQNRSFYVFSYGESTL